MDQVMATSKKPQKKPTPKGVVHICNQEDVLKRHSVLLERQGRVLLGNGNEEDGLLFLLRAHLKEHSVVLEDIKDIKLKLSVVTEVNKELDIQRQVSLRVKAEEDKNKEKKEKTDEIKDRKHAFSWTKLSIVIAALAFVVMAAFQILNYLEREKDTEVVVEKINELKN